MQKSPSFSKIDQASLAALRSASHGFALLEACEGSLRLLCANESFLRITGLLEAEALGIEAGEMWRSLGGAREDLGDALERARKWSGQLSSEWSGKFNARVDPIGAGMAAIWLDRGNESESLRAHLEAALRKVEEASSNEEGSAMSGPKAFWRSVGAVWTVCSRSSLPISLGLVSIGSAEESMSIMESDQRESMVKKSLGKLFRRASDVVGRLGRNSYGVFVVGQDREQSKARLESLLHELQAQGCQASVGMSCGIPERGSSTQIAKAQAKKLNDGAHGAAGSFSEIDFL